MAPQDKPRELAFIDIRLPDEIALAFIDAAQELADEAES